MTPRELIDLARKAKEHAYAPYSHFFVGAAVEVEDGSVYTGCNVEIATLGGSLCAERNAIFKAISDGHRRILKVAIVADKPETYPCGICRQVISEFGENAEIYIASIGEEYRTFTLKQLLPHSFGPESLR